MRRRLGKVERYTCQARTVAGGSLLASMAGLGAVGVGMWLLVYSRDFVQLIGLPLRDAFAGYSVFGAYMTVTGLVGACVSLVRSSIGLMLYAALLLSNSVCQGSIFAYLFLESKEVMSTMNSTIKHTTDCRTLTTIAYKFHCKLDVTEYLNEQCIVDVDSASTQLASCSDNINSWLQKGVWSAVAVAAILIAFQLLLVITSLMLRNMIMEMQHMHHQDDGCCCCKRRHNRTAPATLVSVTPATTSVPQTPRDTSFHNSGGSLGVAPSANPRPPSVQSHNVSQSQKFHHNFEEMVTF